MKISCFLFIGLSLCLVACDQKSSVASKSPATVVHSPSDDASTSDVDAEDDDALEIATGGDADTAEPSTDADDAFDTADVSVEPDEEEGFYPYWPEGTDPFADGVVSFEPGPDAGFGTEDFPDIVLGSPDGGGAGSGSLDVLSLGEGGSIVLEFTDLGLIDGPGADLLIFENPFSGWLETAFVEVSQDGETWVGWPCEAENPTEDFPGCAGVASVFATAEFLVDPTDPDQAGGDAFDLADLGMESARFVRITDSGFNAFAYGGTTGGFDLDAVCAANWTDLLAE